jgi:hypothetical protein
MYAVACAVSAFSATALAGPYDSRLPQSGGTDVFGNLPTEANLVEGFDTVVPAGWTQRNDATPPGLTTWFQGNPAVFPAHSGAPSSYAGANFNNSTGAGNISSWLISPLVSFQAGSSVTFFTRTVNVPSFPDRLHLKFSPTGGTTPADFSVTIATVNPNLTLTGYPSVWTQFGNTALGFAGTNGRFAFHYDVPGGGPAGLNSDYIGVDTFALIDIPEPASLGLVGLAGVALLARRRA